MPYEAEEKYKSVKMFYLYALTKMNQPDGIRNKKYFDKTRQKIAQIPQKTLIELL